MVHLQRIARAPHATGTVANAEVRAYLVAQLRALGLEPEVQSGLGIAPKNGAIGLVHNVIVRLAGQQPGPAVMLVAHYDSAPTSLGAADDGASVAAILETLRALRAGAPLPHDVICLLTDGEEPGLLGARLFAAKHPLARQGGVVLNFEYRGNRGPVWMFETSTGNDGLVRQWSGAAAAPLGNSLLYEIYKRMPNGTDMSVFKQAGMQGLNFAAIGGHTAYHTALDRVERLDVGTLQRQGDTMLSLARHFAQHPAERSAGDRIYFDVPLLGVIGYSAAWLWPLTAVVVALFGVTVAVSLRRAGLRGRAIAQATLLFALQVALVAGACQLLWAGLLLVHPGYRLMLQGDTYNANWYLAAFACLAFALFSLLSGWLRRWFAVMELALGAVACWLVLMLAAAAWMPGASFLLAWPLLFTLLALLLLLLRKGTANTSCVLLALGTVPAILVVVPLLPLVAGAATLSMICVPVCLGTLLLGLAGPVLAALARLRLMPVALLAAVGCLAGGALTASFDAEHPRPYSLFYLANGDTGRASWLSGDEQPDAFTGGFLRNAERRTVPELHGTGGPRVWAAAAPDHAIASPEITVVGDHADGAARELVLDVRSLRQAARLTLAVDGATVSNATIAGEPFSQRPETHWKAHLYGFGGDRIRITLRLERQAPFRLRVNDTSYGLAAVGVAARPAGLVPQPFGSSETVQAVRTLSFNP